MRSKYSKSDKVRFFPDYLRDAGYYCTNNAKEDYNTAEANGIWNESSKEAQYKNRKDDQPFFHVVNIGTSHESSIHKSIPTSELTHDPMKMILPPYHPDTEEMRHDWAQYYDKITAMDKQVGEILKKLEEDGLAENTIVFYYGDHGGVLARSKRFVYESGTRVPFIVKIPEKYKHLRTEKIGDPINQLISFVDLAPTILSVAGIKIPDHMQGKAFLGEQKRSDPEYAFMFRGRMDERYDMSRSVRDHKYRYIINYMPYRIYGQKLEYLWRAPSIRSWEKAYQEGKCNDIQSVFWNKKPVEELYDTENDPWEVNNLANNPEYSKVLHRLRKANNEWMKSIKDCGFIPEAELNRLSGETAKYDYMRTGNVPLNKIIEAADIAALATNETIPQLIEFLKNDNSAIRYWGATGLLILGKDAISAKEELLIASQDKSPNVRIVAAEALYNLSLEKISIKTLAEVLQLGDQFVSTAALNVIDCLNIDDTEIVEAVVKMVKKHEVINRKKYDLRGAKLLFQKWNIPSGYYDIKFTN